MKKYLCLTLLIIVMLVFTACGKVQTVPTAIGDFELSSQKVQASLEDNQGNSFKASDGNILLIVLLKPASGTNVTMDDAQEFFTNGSQAVVDGQTYDLQCMDFEKSGGDILYGLVFDIADNGYSNSKQPTVSLNLPAAMPTPEPTATPAPSVEASTSPTATTSDDAATSPTETATTTAS